MLQTAPSRTTRRWVSLAPLPPPACRRAQMRLVRSVTGKQFTGALDENLRPIMR